MTVKEIAIAVNRPEKTVRTWTKKTSVKMASIVAKMAEANPNNPASYDLEETCAIIAHGLGKNLSIAMEFMK
jgi:hypothetical protein